MKWTKPILFAALAVLLLNACNRDDQTAGDANGAGATEPNLTSEAAVDPNVVATVFGKPISKEIFDAFVKTRHQHDHEPGEEEREALLTQFADLFVLTEGRELTPPANADQLSGADLELATLYTGVQAAVADWQQQHVVDDEDVRERYQAYTGSAVIRDYKLRHLNPVNAVEAGKLFDRLSDGAGFDQLEAELVAANGPLAAGDLGWIPTDALTGDMLTTIDNTPLPGFTAPLASEHGGHVLLIEAVRDVAPPAYDDIAEELRAGIAQQRFQEYVAQRRDAANITLY